jgi:hypothetical protein
VADKRADLRRQSRRPGPANQQRSWFLPGLVALIAVGVAGVVVLALNRESAGLQPPIIGDHWHVAYGVYACDAYLPPSTIETDPLGIHTHADGLIHIHPHRVAATGDRARLHLFLEAIGAQLTDSRYVPGPGEADQRVLDEAEGCDGQPAELRLAYWPDATQDTMEWIDQDLAQFRFHQDGAAIAIALVPEGTETIPRPPFLTQLQQEAQGA